jgi:hypothetical protein
MNYLQPELLYGASISKRQSLADLAKPRARVITRESTVSDIKSLVKEDTNRVMEKTRPASLK